MTETNSTNLFNKIPKSPHIFVIPENGEIKEYKRCKIVVNKITEELTAKIIGDNRTKVMTFAFNRNFFQHEHILFIQNNETENYALLLPSKEKCKQIYDILQEGKVENANDYQKRQQKCHQLLEELKSFNSYTIEKSNPRKQKNFQRSMNFSSESDACINVKSKSEEEDNFSDSENEIEVSQDSCPKPEKPTLSSLFCTPKKQIIKSPNFKLFFFDQFGQKRRRLVIFADNEQKLCYVFFWKNDESAYYCRNCMFQQKKRVIAKVLTNSKGEEYVKLNGKQHICEPQEFIPDEYISHTVEAKEDFRVYNYIHRGISKSTLVIFDPSNKNLCYEYFWDNCRNRYECNGCHNMRTCGTKEVGAVIRKNENGEEYVEMSRNDHICDLRQFNPDKFKSDVIFEKPLFEIFEYTSMEKKWKKLVIFTDAEKKYCYKFAYMKGYKMFGCIKCQQAGLGLFAYLLVDKNGNEYISMKNKQHRCKPVEFILCKFMDKKTIFAPNFQLVTRKTNGKFIKHLAIFNSTDANLCHEFTWCKMRKIYICHPCRAYKIHVHARILTNPDGIEYVELSRNEHKCELQKFKPEKWDEKFIKKPYFEIGNERIKDGTIIKKLTIFDSNDKTKCYSYNYAKKRDIFFCGGCKLKSKYLTAKFHETENYIELNESEHVCKQQKYNPLKVITKSDYILHECIVDGFKRKFIILFDPADKTFCYQYCYFGTDKAYLCVNCKKLGATLVSARFNKTKSGEEFLGLNKNPHICKSVKYNPKEFSSRIVSFGNYKIETNVKNGLEKKTLIVNNSTIKTLYYSYFYSENDGFYICKKCNHKSVNARILKNSNDEEYLALSSKSHSCKPLKRI